MCHSPQAQLQNKMAAFLVTYLILPFFFFWLQVVTQLNPDTNVVTPPRALPKWVIPVCVVGAVLLLVLIVLCLYKVSC